jgi:hypothetical protein
VQTGRHGPVTVQTGQVAVTVQTGRHGPVTGQTGRHGIVTVQTGRRGLVTVRCCALVAILETKPIA